MNEGEVVRIFSLEHEPGRQLVRILGWSGMWVLPAAWLAHDWSAWLRLPFYFACGFAIAGAVQERSLRWRWALLTWRGNRLPITFNEDGVINAHLLWFEELCVGHRDGRPAWAHIHSRHLLTGRQKLRNETRWQ